MGEANPNIRVRAAAVVLDDVNNLLVVRQNDKPFWVLPGGTLEFGETLETCVVRELQEELHLTITVEKLLYVSEFIPPTGGRHVVDTVFLAKLVSDKADLVMTTDENLNEVAWVALDSLTTLPLMPEDIARRLVADSQQGFANAGEYVS